MLTSVIKFDSYHIGKNPLLSRSICISLLHPKFVTMVKGCAMGSCLVLVSPCFRANVVTTCKIGSFLCSLDNLLQENVIVFFFGNQISKWRSFEKKGSIFDLLFTFLK